MSYGIYICEANRRRKAKEREISMSNERYWIFHEWVRSNYILPDGYMPKVWDSLAFSYWFNEKDDYYLQFENKTKEDNEIDLFKNFGNSKSDVDFIKEYNRCLNELDSFKQKH